MRTSGCQRTEEEERDRGRERERKEMADRLTKNAGNCYIFVQSD